MTAKDRKGLQTTKIFQLKNPKTILHDVLNPHLQVAVKPFGQNPLE